MGVNPYKYRIYSHFREKLNVFYSEIEKMLHLLTA